MCVGVAVGAEVIVQTGSGPVTVFPTCCTLFEGLPVPRFLDVNSDLGTVLPFVDVPVDIYVDVPVSVPG